MRRSRRRSRLRPGGDGRLHRPCGESWSRPGRAAALRGDDTTGLFSKASAGVEDEKEELAALEGLAKCAGGTRSPPQLHPRCLRSVERDERRAAAKVANEAKIAAAIAASLRDPPPVPPVPAAAAVPPSFSMVAAQPSAKSSSVCALTGWSRHG